MDEAVQRDLKLTANELAQNALSEYKVRIKGVKQIC